MKTTKPNLDVIKKILLEGDIKIYSPLELRKMGINSIEIVERYYEDVLEAFVGKEVWALLESLISVQNYIEKYHRKNGRKYINFYKREIFKQLTEAEKKKKSND